ncbi:MAG TPA: AgmX/PglI C-terminal domain-containing protein [Polyangiaceae bacterium]|nr:AgmX/PglI C-terminal domain-containing protein [Polyangiaceae bacterium]
MGVTTVSGRLAPELIQRAVRAHFDDFRTCYESGLHSNPKLEGRVSALFKIIGDGSVRSVSDGGSDLPDREVTSCILNEFSKICFPTPPDFGGTVTVVFPLILIPE